MDNQIQSSLVENEEAEIDLKELLFQLLAHWKFLIIFTILFGVAAFAGSKFLITPKYQSTSALYVLSKSTSITSIADLQIGSGLATDYKEVITSRPVLDQVIKNLSLDEEYASLKGRISLTNPSNSRIMEITVTDISSSQAKIITDEIADVAASFISEKMDQDPPNVIQYGYSDNVAVSPNIKRNTVIGAVAGLVFAAIIVLIKHLLSDTIITPDDLEKKLGLHVLGSLPLDQEEDDGENAKIKKKKNRMK